MHWLDHLLLRCICIFHFFFVVMRFKFTANMHAGLVLVLAGC
jgi:uncharacterized membrane protein